MRVRIDAVRRMQGLMDIADEMHKKFQRVPALCGRPRAIGQHLSKFASSRNRVGNF
jgi:hypothetical protein